MLLQVSFSPTSCHTPLNLLLGTNKLLQYRLQLHSPLESHVKWPVQPVLKSNNHAALTKKKKKRIKESTPFVLWQCIQPNRYKQQSSAQTRVCSYITLWPHLVSQSDCKSVHQPPKFRPCVTDPPMLLTSVHHLGKSFQKESYSQCCMKDSFFFCCIYWLLWRCRVCRLFGSSDSTQSLHALSVFVSCDGPLI